MMKLKIDSIEEIIKEANYALENSRKSVCKKDGDRYISIDYSDEKMYIAKEILDNIFPYFINISQLNFEQIYCKKDYEEFSRYGFYLGISYCEFCKPVKPIAYKVKLIGDKVKSIADKQKSLREEATLEILRGDVDENIKNKVTHLFNKRAMICSVLRNTVGVKISGHNISIDDLVGKTYLLAKSLLQKIHNIESELQEVSEKRLSARAKLERRIYIRQEKQAELEELERQAELEELEGAELEKRIYIRKEKQYETIACDFNDQVNEKIRIAFDYREKYLKKETSNIICYFKFILSDSFYPFEFDCKTDIAYVPESKMLVVEYNLPNLEQAPNIKTIKQFKTKTSEIKYLSEKERGVIYDDIIYSITIRSIAEIFYFDTEQVVDVVNFNGMITARDKATGKLKTNCILSVQVKRSQFEELDLNYVNAKTCFKHFKGVGGSKLCDLSAIVPIMEISKDDKRFVNAQNIEINDYTNLASMDWEEFEHLIRELFDMEFNLNGGEVKITQSSRDGGVDAIAFDPDPIRGGKIVIQAKRYTNTVGVSAVRDLYGTVINEGANKGILITTSDYGSDSYSFAKDKPITLLNGGHLLYLLEKHGRKARIDIIEAKKINSTKNEY